MNNKVRRRTQGDCDPALREAFQPVISFGSLQKIHKLLPDLVEMDIAKLLATFSDDALQAEINRRIKSEGSNNEGRFSSKTRSGRDRTAIKPRVE